MPGILVIDDERLAVDLLEMFLKMKGYTVIRAERGEVGLEKATIHAPDAIILDMMMPDLSGDEVCRRLRAMPQTQHTPIIILSALYSTSAQQKARDAGANIYLPKNVPLPELHQQLKKLIPQS
jgi:DNA-binding response OmpR family regulator